MSSVRERLILRPGPVVETIERLVARIFERFGDCGLYRLCAELHAIAKADTRRAVSIGRSYIWLRVLVFATIAAGIAVLGWMLSLIDFTSAASDSVSSTAQGIEAAANLTILTGAAILSLLKLEERLKRRRALAALHELRSIVHVIDMHQLTKDPTKWSAISSASAPDFRKRYGRRSCSCRSSAQRRMLARQFLRTARRLLFRLLINAV